MPSFAEKVIICGLSVIKKHGLMSSKTVIAASFLPLLLSVACSPKLAEHKEKASAGNPVFPGWYADPEGIIFGQEYWIYPTFSDHYPQQRQPSKATPAQLALRKNAINEQYVEQTFFDAFSSRDLVHWERHPRVFDIEWADWASYAIWAPAITEANGQYYLFFSANDIQSEAELGGIGVAVADQPSGPFKDALGKPLISTFEHGAQPIDPFVFKDDDGQAYLIYGGWRHCNIVRLSDDLLRVVPFEDGEVYKEITPDQYVEGPFMFKRNGRYYFMWSEGGWMGPDYSVAYAIGDSPFGPFARIGKVLQQDTAIATGAGHHSVIILPEQDRYYMVYHRRPLGTDNPHHREVCIDELKFDEQGLLLPVKMTRQGVMANPLQSP